MKAHLTSILVVVLVGVSIARFIRHQDDDDDASLRPIVSRSEERRICTELCMSGLGGSACGEDCFDLMPQELPLLEQTSKNRSVILAGAKTRETACPVLCSNNLGYPLCQCDKTVNNNNKDPYFRVDYVEICGFYCVNYNYSIFGCQACSVYQQEVEQATEPSTRPKDRMLGRGIISFKSQPIDWNVWCVRKCGEGEGGSACNCDLLPMMTNN